MALIHAFFPPMPDNILDKFNFFELYPLDGGGHFINEEILGSIEDERIAENILNGALDVFGSLPDLDYGKFERWCSIEKSCWINRFYFLVPLAKYYRKNKDEAIAELVKSTMLHFIRTCPSLKTENEIKEHLDYVCDIRDNNYNKNSWEENQRDETDVKYIWFDFQPASRIIHFIYALYFIRNSPVLSKAECNEIEESIKDHARVIATSESKFEKLQMSENHQSLRGIALLYAGTFFNDEFFMREGIRLCKFHIENDYFADGTLKEISPSYHAFETWHVRDAYMLARQYGFKISENHQEILARAINFLRIIQQPDKHSVVIGDGYPLNLTPYLNSLPEEFTDKAENYCGTFYLADSQLALFRKGAEYICFDVSPYPCEFSHYHAGKGGITYFHAGQPFLIDSGCCSYDDPAFQDYKNARAHSSLLIDGKGDGFFSGLYSCPCYATVQCSGWQNSEVSATITSPEARWHNIVWNRSLKIEKDSFLICDQVINNSGLNKEYCFVFNLHPDIKTEFLNSNKIILHSKRQKLIISFSSEIVFKIKTVQGSCFVDNRHQLNTQVILSITSSDDITLNINLQEYEYRDGF
jgi:hypothetical protein